MEHSTSEGEPPESFVIGDSNIHRKTGLLGGPESSPSHNPLEGSGHKPPMQPHSAGRVIKTQSILGLEGQCYSILLLFSTHLDGRHLYESVILI